MADEVFFPADGPHSIVSLESVQDTIPYTRVKRVARMELLDGIPDPANSLPLDQRTPAVLDRDKWDMFVEFRFESDAPDRPPVSLLPDNRHVPGIHGDCYGGISIVNRETDHHFVCNLTPVLGEFVCQYTHTASILYFCKEAVDFERFCSCVEAETPQCMRVVEEEMARGLEEHLFVDNPWIEDRAVPVSLDALTTVLTRINNRVDLGEQANKCTMCVLERRIRVHEEALMEMKIIQHRIRPAFFGLREYAGLRSLKQTIAAAEHKKLTAKKKRQSRKKRKASKKLVEVEPIIESDVESVAELVFDRSERSFPECLICEDEALEAALQPCGHLCTCFACAGRLTQCPLCRERVRGLIRVYPA